MSAFWKEMMVSEAMAVHPRVAEVFASFHLGGCSHCSISHDETIEQVTGFYGVDVDMLLEALASLLESEGIETAASSDVEDKDSSPS
jgi:hybrid cluster-associated redox disulfide protein